MRGSGLIGLALAVVTALVIADLTFHAGVTEKLISAGTTESRLIAGRG